MKELSTQRNYNQTSFTLSLLPTLRNSPHFKAIREFLLAARRGETRQVLITTLVALTLVLPATALILSNGLHTASHNLKQARLISVFMAPGTEQSIIRELATGLIGNDHIDKTRLVPGTSVIPPMLEVIPSDTLEPSAVIALADNLEVLAGIEFVELNKPRLIENQQAFNLIRLLSTLANLAALVIAAFLTWIVSWRDILSNNNSIKLLSQLGGTYQDIRRPFLYRCPTVGLLAGILGICVSMLLLWFVKNQVDLSTYNSLISIKPTWIQVFSFILVVISVSLLATLHSFSKKFTHYNQ